MASLTRTSSTLRFLFTCLLFTASLCPATAQGPGLTEEQKCLHVLNRVTFGARPGDLERVKRMGIPAFLKEQMDPGTIDDRDCEKELRRYPILEETIASLLMEFPQPGVNIMRPDLRGKVLTEKENGDAYGRIFGMANELAAAKLTRVVVSKRQFQEVMADFWFNHFNVAFDKEGAHWLVGAYEREAIRPHVLGNFKDLLTAVAKSPAMLVYLDNNDNYADPNFHPVAEPAMMGGSMTMMMQSPPGKGRRINENYARELLELHTLGVDGGYSQKDVVETARVFTGWAAAGLDGDSAPQPVVFKFKDWHHDANEKVILGRTFGPNEGVKEGEEVLAMLSRRPETAKRIATKLCQRFVADLPPQALVDKVADKFLETDGDIKATLRALFDSSEFYDPKNYRVKVKTPLEFVASALRALDAQPSDWWPTLRVLEAMGQPLYRCEAPTGYPLTANAWVSSSALLARSNYAAGLFDQREKGMPAFDLTPFEKGAGEGGGAAVLQNSFDRLLNGEISEATRRALTKRQAGLDTRKLAALVMASPDFQRR